MNENNRLDKSDPDTVVFEDFLLRLRDGLNDFNNFELLRKKRSYDTIGPDGWKIRGFKSEDIMHLFTTNQAVKTMMINKLWELEIQLL